MARPTSERRKWIEGKIAALKPGDSFDVKTKSERTMALNAATARAKYDGGCPRITTRGFKVVAVRE